MAKGFYSVAVYYAVQGASELLNLRMKSLSVTIQMKATEQYVPVVLFIILQGGSNF